MKRLFSVLVFLVGAFPFVAVAASFSGTLPVLYINTENNVPVVSKDDYVSASYYIDNLGLAGYESVGSVDNKLPLQIKGRGNYTWSGFDKKPYRLKLDSKAALLGMKKNKHFALLAHADDNFGFLRNTVGFELSRRIGLAFTPEQRPVEVVLNGDYIGLYFLTEVIRVDKDRVNIVEQDDNETDAEKVTGGWIVEIDNYYDPAQIEIREGNGENIRFTYKSPEVLSYVQENYLRNLVTAADRAIYSQDKNSMEWERYIDMDSLACFYIVQEIVDNAESFHGSCYFHKERGADTKMIFGPVWDFGNSFHRGTSLFIHQYPPFGQTWIGEIAKFPRFQECVRRYWHDFYANGYVGIEQFIDSFVDKISAAAAADAVRWPDYGNPNMNYAKKQYIGYLRSKTAFLLSQWGEAGITADKTVPSVKILSSVVHDGIVRIAGGEKIKDIAAFDVAGRRIRMELSGNGQAWITASQGVYVVKILTEDGQCVTSKLIVE